MNKEKIDSLPIQVFYTSKEETNCPFVVDLIKIIKKLKEKKLIKENDQPTISFTYGKRILINSLIKDLSKIKKEELLEIVDYDPVKNNLLVIGSADPKIETTLHYMLHYAKKEIKIVLQLNNNEILEKIGKKVPILDDKLPINSIDFIKQVLKTLRDNKILGIKNKGMLIVSKNSEELYNTLEKHLEGKNENWGRRQKSILVWRW